MTTLEGNAPVGEAEEQDKVNGTANMLNHAAEAAAAASEDSSLPGMPKRTPSIELQSAEAGHLRPTKV